MRRLIECLSSIAELRKYFATMSTDQSWEWLRSPRRFTWRLTESDQETSIAWINKPRGLTLSQLRTTMKINIFCVELVIECKVLFILNLCFFRYLIKCHDIRFVSIPSRNALEFMFCVHATFGTFRFLHSASAKAFSCSPKTTKALWT